MKSFEDICRMTQMQVKSYMKDYLSSKKYNVVSEDGFIYAKGLVPVLLVAHMDTVHTEQCKKIIHDGNKLSSPQGIGGDDRCGIYIIMNLVKEFNCSVLLCEDEECGGIGAKKFTKATYTTKNADGKDVEVKYIDTLDVNYMIEFDRKGNNDAVFYSCDNKDFTNFVTDSTGYKFAYGSYSDISTLMPAAKLAAVNLSSGYYNAHQTSEYVMYDEMMDTVEAGRALIKAECNEPFKYIAKSYSYTNPNYNYGERFDYRSFKEPAKFPVAPKAVEKEEYYGNIYDMPQHTDQRLYEIARNDKTMELEVCIMNLEMREEVLYSEGDTKAECWMNFFLDNPDICFNQVTDYNWC